MSNNKTLATAKHGGCVQLGSPERERFEAWAESAGYALTLEDGRYEFAATRCVWTAWIAATESRQMGPQEPAAWVPPNFFNKGVVAATARRNPPSETAVELRGEYVPLYLSAQPSPGGQDALAEAARRVISDVDSGDYGGTISMATYDALVAALADRQPVGEPPMEMRICELRHVSLKPNRSYIFTVDANCANCRADAAYAMGQTDTRPAQAVDLDAMRALLQRRIEQWRSHLPADPGAPGTREIETKGEHDYNNDVRIYREGIAVMEELLSKIDSQAVGNG